MNSNITSYLSDSKLTAISRNKLSTPILYIHKKGLLKGSILDYGCGKGGDVKYLHTLGYKDCCGYDPNYQPVLPIDRFDTVLCTYVLNVIPCAIIRNDVIETILKSCKGHAYVTVRNDANALNGWTGKNTWQGLITLDYPVIHKTSSYIIYKID